MYGRSHDVDKSFADCDEGPSFDDMQTQIEELKEELEIHKKMGLRALVLEYERDIQEFLAEVRASEGNTCHSTGKTKVLVWDTDEIRNFLEKLVKGAHEIL